MAESSTSTVKRTTSDISTFNVQKIEEDGTISLETKTSSWFKSLGRRKKSEPSNELLKKNHRSSWDVTTKEGNSGQDSVENINDGLTQLTLCSLPDLTKENVQSNYHLYYTIDRRLASRHKIGPEEKLLWNGIKQFNLDPGRGIKFLQESSILGKEPVEIAKFLFGQDRLSKNQIGAYLGVKESLHQAVLAEFVACHYFKDLLLVQALRQFLWSFRLPGEAQQIDRVMSCFASHYCEQNPTLITSPDTVYILSFAIIMLNTGLHNPNVRLKITEHQFLAQNTGIDAGSDIPSSMLCAIYQNIKEEPFQIPKETYSDVMFTFFSPDREGWMEKQGGTWKNWKRRWFVLSDRCLYYFQHTAENSPKGIIPLENVGVREVPGDKDRPWQLEIFSTSEQVVGVKGCKTDTGGTVVVGNHKVYRLATKSKDEREQWLVSLMEAVRINPVLTMIEKKKAEYAKGSITNGK